MNTQDFWIKLDNFYAQKDIKGAEDIMLEQLNIARAADDKISMITVINELGGFYRTLSRYDEAMPLFDAALTYIDELGFTGSESHGTTLLNYATLCTLAGEKEKALGLYEKVTEIFSGPQYTRDYRLATLYNNMSFLCQDLGRHEDAISYLNNALEILGGLSESEVEIAITYGNMGRLQMAENDLDGAKESIMKSLALFEDNGLTSDIHYSASVSALGEVYFFGGDFAASKAQFEKSLSLIERDLGTDNDTYRLTLGNIRICDERIEQ